MMSESPKSQESKQSRTKIISAMKLSLKVGLEINIRMHRLRQFMTTKPALQKNTTQRRQRLKL